MRIPLIIVGIVMSAGTFFWWHSEIAGMLGQPVSFSGSTACLLNLGTGGCQKLWFLGMHQTNQLAGIIFYAGILMAGFGLFLPGQRRRDDGDEFIERPNTPPHL